MRKSLILYAVEALGARLRAVFGASGTARLLSGMAPRVEKELRRGRLGAVSDEEKDRRAWQYRLRRAVMRAEEGSLILRLLRCVKQAFLSTSIGCYGLFGVLYGVFSAAVWLSTPSTLRTEAEIIASLGIAVLCVPLLHSSRSLSYGICNSRILRWLLIDFCGLSEELLGGEGRGREHYWITLFAAFFFGAGSVFLSANRFLIILAILPVLILLFASPRLFSTLLLFFLPFLTFFPNPTRILSACAFSIELSWLRKAMAGRRELRLGVPDVSVLLLAFAVLCGGLFGMGGRSGLFHAVSACVLILFWFPMRNLFCRERWQGRALSALKASAFLSAAWGVAEYALGRSQLRWVDPARFSDIGGRVCGPFENPNLFAVFLVMTLPLFLAGCVDSLSFRGRLLHFCSFALVGLCLILTWSRGAWLAMIAAILFFLAVYSARTLGYLLLGMIPAAVGAFFLPHSITNRFLSIGSFSESSISYRFYTWKGVRAMLRVHPWGIGAGNEAFAAVYPSYAVSGTESAVHAHRLFLQVSCEYGIQGLLSLLFFLLILFFSAAYALRVAQGRRRGMRLALICGVGGALIMGVFDYIWYHFGMLLLFFGFAALIPTDREEEFGV